MLFIGDFCIMRNNFYSGINIAGAATLRCTAIALRYLNLYRSHEEWQ